MTKILDQIKNANLTPTERKIGDFIINNQNKVVFMTANKLAKAIQVSDASIVRFTRSIGFDGFVEFKQALQAEQEKNYHVIPNELTIPTERLAKSSQYSNSEYFFYAHWEMVNENIQSILTKNTFKHIDKAINYMLESKKKYVYGSRGRTGIAEFMTLMLSHCLEDVHFVGNQYMTPFDYLADADEDDLLILLSFPRYSLLDEEVIHMADKLKMKILLITDSMNCKFIHKSDLTLFVDVSSDTFFNSYTSSFFFVDYLCGLVSKHIGEENKEKLNLINTHLSSLKNY